MRRVYLRAGLYAEGPTDYEFLCPLLNRHLDDLAAPLFPSNYEVADTIGIDGPPEMRGRRADRIAAAVADYADACEIFVIHADGASDPAGARRTNVLPGIATAQAALPEQDMVAVACIPVREIEAWLLTDRGAFRDLLGNGFDAPLPAEPEKELDPKATLRRILAEGGARRGPESIYALFGERVRFETLRALPAFQAFEAELREAIKRVARAQGHRA